MNREIPSTNACEDYPHNLLWAVQGHNPLALPSSLTKDVLAGLQYALLTLKEDSQLLVQLCFQQKLSVEEATAILSLPVQQIKALEADTLQKLRIPSRWGYIQYGLTRYMKQKAASAHSKGFREGYREGYRKGMEDGRGGVEPPCPSEALLSLPLECISLSPRVQRILLRADFRTIGDITGLDEYQILSLPGLGAKGADEVARGLRHNGITDTAWEYYLLG